MYLHIGKLYEQTIVSLMASFERRVFTLFTRNSGRKVKDRLRRNIFKVIIVMIMMINIFFTIALRPVLSVGRRWCETDRRCNIRSRIVLPLYKS